MIKTFLKHYIYEFCINTFFENLIYNFPPPRILSIRGCIKHEWEKIFSPSSLLGKNLSPVMGQDIERIFLERILEKYGVYSKRERLTWTIEFIEFMFRKRNCYD